MTDIEYDPEVHILNILLIDKGDYPDRYHHSIDEAFTCLLDVDGDGRLIGIEILLPKEVQYD